jgi:hypothetical protein
MLTKPPAEPVSLLNGSLSKVVTMDRDRDYRPFNSNSE